MLLLDPKKTNLDSPKEEGTKKSKERKATLWHISFVSVHSVQQSPKDSPPQIIRGNNRYFEAHFYEVGEEDGGEWGEGYNKAPFLLKRVVFSAARRTVGDDVVFARGILSSSHKTGDSSVL